MAKVDMLCPGCRAAMVPVELPVAGGEVVSKCPGCEKPITFTFPTLDVFVVLAIKSGATRHAKIIEVINNPPDEHWSIPEVWKTGDKMRLVDKALQRLRKANCVVYVNPVQGWKVVE